MYTYTCTSIYTYTYADLEDQISVTIRVSCAAARGLAVRSTLRFWVKVRRCMFSQLFGQSGRVGPRANVT